MLPITKSPLRRVPVGVALTALCAGAASQELPPVTAERPGFSSSPVVLAPSTLQLESGYQYTRERGSTDVDDHTLPFALVRVGLIERLELQLGWAGYSWRETNGQDLDGAYDANIGLKWQVSDGDASLPLALFAGVTLPTGNRRFGRDGVEPSIGAFWSYSLQLDWFGTALLSEVNDEVLVGNALGANLPVATDVSSYIEYFGIYGASGGPEHYLNGGVAYLPRNDMQLDLYLGAGLNGVAADFFLGFGIAYRF